ncbi:MAG: hypothetical protein U0800_09275 [Isosphaeraceae bacterium]
MTLFRPVPDVRPSWRADTLLTLIVLLPEPARTVPWFRVEFDRVNWLAPLLVMMAVSWPIPGVEPVPLVATGKLLIVSRSAAEPPPVLANNWPTLLVTVPVSNRTASAPVPVVTRTRPAWMPRKLTLSAFGAALPVFTITWPSVIRFDTATVSLAVPVVMVMLLGTESISDGLRFLIVMEWLGCTPRGDTTPFDMVMLIEAARWPRSRCTPPS